MQHIIRGRIKVSTKKSVCKFIYDFEKSLYGDLIREIAWKLMKSPIPANSFSLATYIK